MTRKAMAGIAAALILAVTAGCDSPASVTPTASGTIGTANPVVLEGGAADIGIKWNWNLKPPLAFASKVGWGETFFEVEWCAVRDLPEANRFRQLERILTQSQQMGYRLMVKIRVGGCSGGPEQLDPAEGTRKRPSSLPDDPAAYQQFVTNLVTRYSPRGVKIWAIENEVDANNFWQGSPQDYVQTVKLAADAIRRADPQATILDAGISSTGYGIALAGELLDAGHDQEALELYQGWYDRRHDTGTARFPVVGSVDELRSLLQDGRAKRVRAMVAANWEAVNSGAVTAYQLHFYENPDLLPTLLSYIQRHLTRPLPIQGWEIGTAWPGDGYTEQIHGAETARLIGSLLAAQVSPVVYLPLAYTPGGATKVEIFRGLVSPEGQELPSGQVYARYAAALRASTAIRGVSFDGGTGVLIVGPSGTLAAVWPTSTGQLTLKEGSAVAASAPTTPVATGASVAGPLLIDLSSTDAEKALREVSSDLGVTVSAGG